jgi:Flp pilus assembly protein TadB
VVTVNAALLSALFGTLVVGGLVGAGLALRRRPVQAPVVRRASGLVRRAMGMSRRTRLVLAVAVGGGLLIALLTGWFAVVVILPAAALGLPYLLAAPPTAATIRRLEAMEEWTRNLAGVLGSGVGLEQAITATLRSTPDEIKPEVTALVARLRARWDTDAALRAFADDLDDVTGDLIVANLVLAAQRRNRSLATALQGVAESVGEDVASRRKVEAGRAKPRSSARLVTMFSAGVLVWLAFTGDYVAPYGTPLGQVLLLVLVAAYAAGLFWMRRMTEGRSPARFLGPSAKAGAR